MHVSLVETTYFDSSRALITSGSDPRSTLRIDGGFARVNPVPVTFQSARSKALRTCRPRRPVAPVMRQDLAIVWGIVVHVMSQ
jgi:hypothetical protein